MEEETRGWNVPRAALWAAAGMGAWMIGREILARKREADLQGQVVLITGGSRGLGLLLARAFAREGCRIAFCARDVVELERAQEDLKKQGAQVLAVRCDISDRNQAARLVQEVLDHYDWIDILVNNAGIIEVGPIHNMTLQDFEAAMDTNFWGTVYTTLAALPHMKRRRSGRIVNIASVGGKVSVPHLVPYSCSKFATVGFSEGLRSELARDGITVTTIAPGLMRTGSHVNAYIKGKQEEEYAAFGLAATLPGISMNAEQAARQIVEATKRGEAERVLGIPARLMTRFHGLCPGAATDLFGFVNRVALPTADGGKMTSARGGDVQERMRSPWLSLLMTLGRVAAQRLHQNPGSVSRPLEKTSV